MQMPDDDDDLQPMNGLLIGLPPSVDHLWFRHTTLSTTDIVSESSRALQGATPMSV